VPVTLDVQQAATNLPAGVVPVLCNWMMTPEGMAPRSGLSRLGPALGAGSLSSAVGPNMLDLIAELPCPKIAVSVELNSKDVNDLVVASGGTLAWFAGSKWTAISKATQASIAVLVSGVVCDSTVIFDPVAVDNALVITQPNFASGTALLYQYRAGSGKTVSKLTNSPNAKVVAHFDDRVIFANHVSGGGNDDLETSITWSARGNPLLYTEPSGGAEDLATARGAIVRLMDEEDRLLVFTTREIWAGTKIAFPFDLEFRPLDRSMGCPHPRSLARTPRGIMFLGYDQNVYLLPKGGAQVQAIGDRIQHDLIASTVVPSEYTGNRTFATYDAWRQEYYLYPQTPSSKSGSREGFVLNLRTGAWSRTSFAIELCNAASMNPSWSSVPCTLYGSSFGTVFMTPSAGSGPESYVTTDMGSNYSAYALFPIPNENPTQKLYLRDVYLDYSNYTALGGSSLTLACSSDFGQSYDKQVAVSLPHTTVSRQTVVNVGYAATYPSIELRYESQQTGTALRIKRITAMVAPIGTPGAP
jgi:hypothetical protein